MVSKHFPKLSQNVTSPYRTYALTPRKGPLSVRSALEGEVYSSVLEMLDAAAKAAPRPGGRRRGRERCGSAGGEGRTARGRGGWRAGE